MVQFPHGVEEGPPRAMTDYSRVVSPGVHQSQEAKKTTSKVVWLVASLKNAFTSLVATKTHSGEITVSDSLLSRKIMELFDRVELLLHFEQRLRSTNNTELHRLAEHVIKYGNTKHVEKLHRKLDPIVAELNVHANESSEKNEMALCLQDDLRKLSFKYLDMTGGYLVSNLPRPTSLL